VSGEKKKKKKITFCKNFEGKKFVLFGKPASPPPPPPNFHYKILSVSCILICAIIVREAIQQ